jgi:hypothetical protein
VQLRYWKFTRAHARGGARGENHDSERERDFVQDAIFCLCRFVDRDSQFTLWRVEFDIRRIICSHSKLRMSSISVQI